MCPASSPADRPKLNGSGKECRKYFCKSCLARLVATSHSSDIIRYTSCHQLYSSSFSYRNATEFIEQAAVAQNRRQSANAKIRKAQKNRDYLRKWLSNFVSETVKSRFLSVVLIPTTIVLRFSLSYSVLEILDRLFRTRAWCLPYLHGRCNGS